MPIKFIYKKSEIITEYTRDTTVAKALRMMELLPEAHLVMRNGELLTEHELLRDGDEIVIISVISGGYR